MTYWAQVLSMAAGYVVYLVTVVSIGLWLIERWHKRKMQK